MADIPQMNPKWTITGTGTNLIGDVDRLFVGTFAVQFVNTGSFVGTIKIQSRLIDAAPDAVTSVQVPYLARYLNAAVSDNLYHTADITDASLIYIPASGENTVINCSAYTSGTMTVYVRRLVGAAA